MAFSKNDIQDTIKRYESRYNNFGYSPKSLGWDKGKQELRFDILTSNYKFNNKHILDIGCGFGDLNKTLGNITETYKYTGVDIVPALLDEAIVHYNNDNINFINSNILDFGTSLEFDYAISSGIFNHKIEGDNYEFIENVIKHTLNICKDGLAFDFLSDKVDFTLQNTFHSSPEKILSIAYKYSRNIVFRNDYMPFEFALFIFKDDSFREENTIFNSYLKNL